MLMNAEYYSKIIEALIELIDEGVYIVDQDGVGQYYNKAMASMEKVNMDDVLGKSSTRHSRIFAWEKARCSVHLQRKNPH